MTTIHGDVVPSLANVDVSLGLNRNPRLPLVLIVDTSGSMSGQPIAELNAD